jgi:hypothetical protein
MPISKIKTSSITADAASINLNIDAGTLFLDVANNRVGIADTSPGERLQISSATDTSVRLVTTAASGKNYNITAGGGGNYSSGVFAIRNVTDATTPFAIYADNVGIGTTGPSTKLQVIGTITGAQFRTATSSGHYGWTAGSQGAIFSTNSTPGLAAQFIVDNAGRGTSVSTQDDNGASTGTQFRFGLGASTGATSGTIAVNDNTTGGYNTLSIFSSQVIFSRIGSESMRIASNGNVAIGTSITAVAKVNIQLAGTNISGNTTGVTMGAGAIFQLNNSNASATNSTVMLLGGGTGDTTVGQISSGIGFSRESENNWGTQLRFYTHPADTDVLSTLNERMRINSAGNMVLGTSTNGGVDDAGFRCRINFAGSNGLRLDTTNTNANLAVQFVYNNNVMVGSIATTTTSTSYGTGSDYRLKENIAPMTGALTKVEIGRAHV